MGYAAMTSTSAYFAACADATQPFIRTVFFFALPVTMVAIVSLRTVRTRLQTRGFFSPSPAKPSPPKEARYKAVTLKYSLPDDLRDFSTLRPAARVIPG